MNNEKNEDKNLWLHYQKNQPEVFSSTHDRHNKVLGQVKKYLQPQSKILEIGFGDGYLLKELSKTYDCYGADISEEFVEKIEGDIINVKFKTIDTDGKMPYENNFFDGLIASEVLEHMSDEELKICIDEIKRILKKNGYIFITVPAEENLKENECVCPNCLTRFHKWGHKQFWTENKIRKLFKDFDIIKIRKMIIDSNCLNIFGKIDMIIRRIAIRLFEKKLSGMTFLIIIKR